MAVAHREGEGWRIDEVNGTDRINRTNRTNKTNRMSMNEDFDYEKLVREVLRNVMAFFLAALVCGLVGLLLGGCRTVRYVSVPEYHEVVKVRTDSVMRMDSVWMHDSVSVFVRGDTVFRDKYTVKYKWRYVDRVCLDTLCRRDSVRVPYPVERELGWWERTKQDCFGALACVCGGLFVSLGWIIRSRRNGRARGEE